MHNIVLNIVNTLNHYFIPLIRLALCLRLCTLIGVCLVVFNVSAQDQPVSAASGNNTAIDQAGDNMETASVSKTNEPNEEPEAIERFQPDINGINKQRLMDAFLQENVNKYRVSGELVTLNTADTAFLAVWEPSRNPTPLGAVLLLHGEGQTLDSPQAIGVIRSVLPDHGWATLSVSINTPPEKIIPKRIIDSINSNSSGSVESNSDNNSAKKEGVESDQAAPADDSGDAALKNSDAESSQNTESNTLSSDVKTSEEKAAEMNASKAKTREEMKAKNAQDAEKNAAALALLLQEQDIAYGQDVLARLQSGLAFLNEKGQFNIAVVAHGTGALYIKQLASQMQAQSGGNTGGITTTIRAVILVNARNNSHLGTQEITTLFTKDNYPTLDVFFDTHIADQIEPKQRLKAAKQAKSQDYYQVKLKPPSTRFHEGENSLTRRVRGFLNRFAKGVEIEG